MDVLLAAFIAVLAAETGGKVQANMAVLSTRFPGGRPFLILVFTTLISLGIGSAGGAFIARTMQARAELLLVAIALLFAGATMFMPVRARQLAADAGLVRDGLPRLAAAQLGDASQFLVFALAAWSVQPVVATLAGTVAVMVAATIPLLLPVGQASAKALLVTRRIAAVACLLLGSAIALMALRLI